MASFAHLMLPILCIWKTSQVNDHTGLISPILFLHHYIALHPKEDTIFVCFGAVDWDALRCFPRNKNQCQKMGILSQDATDPTDERWSIAHGCLDVAGYALMRRTERQLGSGWKERPSVHSILNWPYQFVLAAICGLLRWMLFADVSSSIYKTVRNSHGLGK